MRRRNLSRHRRTAVRATVVDRIQVLVDPSSAHRPVELFEFGRQRIFTGRVAFALRPQAVLLAPHREHDAELQLALSVFFQSAPRICQQRRDARLQRRVRLLRPLQ